MTTASPLHYMTTVSSLHYMTAASSLHYITAAASLQYITWQQHHHYITWQQCHHYSTWQQRHHYMTWHWQHVCHHKCKGLCTRYSAAYTSQTRAEQRFTISQVAADWHELMILRCIMQPSIACNTEQLDPRFSKTDHCPINHTRPSTTLCKLLPKLISHPTKGSRLSRPEHTVG